MVETEILELSGTAEKIIFRNAENGYTVVDVNSGDETITAVGTMPWINEGESLQLVGKWESHPDFGKQFSVREYTSSMPLTCDSIIKYISSGIVEGIGMRTAQKLVDKFKEDTINVIKDTPLRMCDIRGITENKANKISQQLNKIIDMSNINKYLSRYGILPSETVKIYKVLGKDAIDKIQSDPYILCFDGMDVDFNKADAIAADIDSCEENPLRIKSGVLYVLKHNMNNGHTCLPSRKLIPVASDFLGVDCNDVQKMYKICWIMNKLFHKK